MRAQNNKFHKDNLLGWSEDDFLEVRLLIAHCCLDNNIPLHPSVLKAFCGASDRAKYAWLREEKDEQRKEPAPMVAPKKKQQHVNKEQGSLF